MDDGNKARGYNNLTMGKLEVMAAGTFVLVFALFMERLWCVDKFNVNRSGWGREDWFSSTMQYLLPVSHLDWFVPQSSSNPGGNRGDKEGQGSSSFLVCAPLLILKLETTCFPQANLHMKGPVTQTKMADAIAFRFVHTVPLNHICGSVLWISWKHFLMLQIMWSD